MVLYRKSTFIAIKKKAEIKIQKGPGIIFFWKYN